MNLYCDCPRKVSQVPKNPNCVMVGLNADFASFVKANNSEMKQVTFCKVSAAPEQVSSRKCPRAKVMALKNISNHKSGVAGCNDTNSKLK